MVQGAARVWVGLDKANGVRPVDVAFKERVSASFGPLERNGCP